MRSINAMNPQLLIAGYSVRYVNCRADWRESGRRFSRWSAPSYGGSAFILIRTARDLGPSPTTLRRSPPRLHREPRRPGWRPIGSSPRLKNQDHHTDSKQVVTSASRPGIPSHTIRRQTSHASDDTVSRYVREGQLFAQNVAGHLL